VEKQTMKHYPLKTPARQAGLTLLELTVVMTILVALAGLTIPYVSSFFGAARDSTSVSSLAEVDKLMQSYSTKFMKEPNNMEALINGVTGASTTDTNCSADNAAANTVYCKLMFPGYFLPLKLTNEQLSSLNMAGIASLYYNDPTTLNATFASTVGVPTILSTANFVAQVVNPNTLNAGTTWTPPTTNPPATGTTPTIEDYLADVFATTAHNFDGQNCYVYVAFGVGNQSSLTGTVMSTAPVHFTSDGSAGPVVKYNRYLAIYQVDAQNNPSPIVGVATGLNPTVMTKGCPSGIEPAKYMGSAFAGNFAEGHLVGLARTQGTVYENINSNSGN
jgi:type II secretory pathway pseudopilin PulG